jgi:hypothetical protein
MVRPGSLAERGSQTIGVIVRKCLEQIVERLHGSSLKYRYFPTSSPAHWHFLDGSAVKRILARKMSLNKSFTAGNNRRVAK